MFEKRSLDFRIVMERATVRRALRLVASMKRIEVRARKLIICAERIDSFELGSLHDLPTKTHSSAMCVLDPRLSIWARMPARADARTGSGEIWTDFVGKISSLIVYPIDRRETGILGVTFLADADDAIFAIKTRVREESEAFVHLPKVR